MQDPQVDRSGQVVGDIKPLSIEGFGKLPLTMLCVKGGVHAKLLDVAYVPGPRFNMCPLYAVMPKCSVILDIDGAHMLGRSCLTCHGIHILTLRPLGPSII